MSKKPLFLLLIAVFCVSAAGQETENKKSAAGTTATGSVPPAAPVISTEYEASPAYPFGRLNPAAPPETAEFSFIIGEFDCADRIRNPQTGKWFEMRVLRRAAFVLNGHAIQDQNWLPIFNTSNFRSYDAKEKKWKVTYFKMPEYQTGVWEGTRQGENIVLRQGSDKKGSRLTFFDIKDDQYSWKGESLTNGKVTLFWEFTCRRRR